MKALASKTTPSYEELQAEVARLRAELDTERVRKKNKVDRGFVYGIVDPRDPQKLHYVGKTSLSIRSRASGHMAAAREGSKRPLYVWIRKILKAHVEPGFVELEKCDENLTAKERSWIRKMTTAGHPIKNVENGPGKQPLSVKWEGANLAPLRQLICKYVRQLGSINNALRQGGDAPARCSESLRSLRRDIELIAAIRAPQGWLDQMLQGISHSINWNVWYEICKDQERARARYGMSWGHYDDARAAAHEAIVHLPEPSEYPEGENQQDEWNRISEKRHGSDPAFGDFHHCEPLHTPDTTHDHFRFVIPAPLQFSREVRGGGRRRETAESSFAIAGV